MWKGKRKTGIKKVKTEKKWVDGGRRGSWMKIK